MFKNLDSILRTLGNISYLISSLQKLKSSFSARNSKELSITWRIADTPKTKSLILEKLDIMWYLDSN